ncbi:hypothetical protein DSO57_1035273 [Entomophthora muscae]|uniref:Uncharacterized protein n=1 Tax=Entomophthora muscae TaxID=34485 RepID=A0ACC2UA07_9FUNG|nr:hypothetical protein DSO57_1035273 [Entomophthora muscae]
MHSTPNTQTERGIKPHEIHPRVGVIRYAEDGDEDVQIINVQTGVGKKIPLSPREMLRSIRLDAIVISF